MGYMLALAVVGQTGRSLLVTDRDCMPGLVVEFVHTLVVVVAVWDFEQDLTRLMPLLLAKKTGHGLCSLLEQLDIPGVVLEEGVELEVLAESASPRHWLQ